MRNGYRASVLAMISVVIGIGGCAESGPDGRPAVVPLAVIVTFNGQPVQGATVAFLADGGNHSSSGVTDTNGRAPLGTFGDGDGVVPGKYKVTIRKVTVTTTGGDANVKVESPDSDLLPGQVVRREELPPKYGQPDTSGLTADVSKGGPKEIKFELTN